MDHGPVSRLIVRSREGVTVATVDLATRGLSGDDPGLLTTLGELLAAPQLPVAVRTPVPGGGRAVGVQHVRPGDADYALALAEAIARRTGHTAALA